MIDVLLAAVLALPVADKCWDYPIWQGEYDQSGICDPGITHYHYPECKYHTTIIKHGQTWAGDDVHGDGKCHSDEDDKPAPFALQDDGYGKCPAFYHPHDGDDRCFDNDDNPQVEHGPVLPVPHYEL